MKKIGMAESSSQKFYYVDPPLVTRLLSYWTYSWWKSTRFCTFVIPETYSQDFGCLIFFCDSSFAFQFFKNTFEATKNIVFINDMDDSVQTFVPMIKAKLKLVEIFWIFSSLFWLLIRTAEISLEDITTEEIDTIGTFSVNQKMALIFRDSQQQQECIPVGYVPPAAVAVGESASVHAGIHSPLGVGLETPPGQTA